MEQVKTLNYEEQELLRQDRLNEVGTEEPCPWCLAPRVPRSDYIRCNSHGVNWLKGEDLTKDPRNPRMQQYMAAQLSAGVRSIENKR